MVVKINLIYRQASLKRNIYGEKRGRFLVGRYFGNMMIEMSYLCRGNGRGFDIKNPSRVPDFFSLIQENKTGS